jgi:glycosyltransferase involved in cell wall biosynthesis
MVGAGRRAGGVPPFVGGGAAELERRGVAVRILATDLSRAPWGWVQRQRRINADGVHPSLVGTDLLLFPARFPRRLAFSPALYRAAQRTAPEFDVVHIHNLWQFPQYAAHRAAAAAGVPSVVSPHGSFDPFLRQKGRLRKRLMTATWHREMLESAALIHVTTEAEHALITDIAPDVPRAVVPCGLYTDQFSKLPERDLFRHERLGGYDGPLILFLGRVTLKKGVDVLIEAFARVRRECEALLAIVGPDDEGLLPSLQRLVERLGIGRDVVFVGPAYGEDRLAALAAADVWALSSHTENFGIAVAEAMAAGCAVVISPAVNIADEAAEADAAIVAELAPERFAGALLALLTNEHRRDELRRTAKEFSKRYDWSAVAPRLLEMYREVSHLGRS